MSSSRQSSRESSATLTVESSYAISSAYGALQKHYGVEWHHSVRRPSCLDEDDAYDGFLAHLEKIVRFLPDTSGHDEKDSTSPPDEYGVRRSAPILYLTWLMLSDLQPECSEAALRRPYDLLIEKVFKMDDGLHWHFDVEVPLPMPPISPELSELLNLNKSSPARADALAMLFVPIDMSGLTQVEVTSLALNRDVHLLPTNMHVTQNRRIALPGLTVEYQPDGLADLQRQLRLDLTIELQHRRRINLRDGYWFRGTSAVIEEYSDGFYVGCFVNWVAFYLFLVRIRTSMKADQALSMIEVPAGSSQSSGPLKRKRASSMETPADAREGVTPAHWHDPVSPQTRLHLHSPVPIRAHGYDHLLGLDTVRPDQSSLEKGIVGEEESMKR
ncbi:hypothetical protein EXIGLDRAFT_703139 [Exidia glandulosa HHB12029]|uniref:Uncharacterized protein n=1 Tax=Exidia glandulosa HHB12029 TaxID=1314781 RepID=A0A165C633_EXIGL|nr:hypothetical protein EXIGLDRAFT_703139 [Exidia glandulosa HHB12029]